jgi:HEAT repeat protein
LINALKGSSTGKIIEFINYQKYNQRYALLFSFAAGLFSSSDVGPSLKIFWDTILGEPLDLVGIRHMQLVISCLDETSAKSTFPLRTESLQWIAKCIQYSVSTENKIILEHLTKSLQRTQSVACDQIIINVFIDCLRHDNKSTKLEVLSFISELKISNPSTALITSITTSLNDENKNIRMSACRVLGKIGRKAATNEIISMLVSALGDDSKAVRGNACRALGRMGEKAATNEAISKIVNVLRDENEYVRANACETLGGWAEKAATKEVISNLVSTLGDDSEYVRASACRALENMGEKTATTEVISRLVNALGDESEDVRAIACKALGEMGEKTAATEVISKLVNALGDGSEDVRAIACNALGEMGEKAATTEVISKLFVLVKEECAVSYEAADAMGNMMSSSVLIAQFEPQTILDLCLSKHGSRCLKNVSVNELVDIFFSTKRPEWLSLVTHLMLLQGAALRATKNKLLMYDRKEPFELSVPSIELGQQLIDALTDQAKRLHLFSEMKSEVGRHVT